MNMNVGLKESLGWNSNQETIASDLRKQRSSTSATKGQSAALEAPIGKSDADFALTASSRATLQTTRPPGALVAYSVVPGIFQNNYYDFIQKQSTENGGAKEEGVTNTSKISALSIQRYLASTQRLGITDPQSLRFVEGQILRELMASDHSVRNHELAHVIAGGQYITGGGPKYQTVRGPDGKSYAIASDITIDTSEIPNNPAETLKKAREIRKAALSPSEPSAQDLDVAAKAVAMEAKAQRDLERLAQQVAQERAAARDLIQPPDNSELPDATDQQSSAAASAAIGTGTSSDNARAQLAFAKLEGISPVVIAPATQSEEFLLASTRQSDEVNILTAEDKASLIPDFKKIQGAIAEAARYFSISEFAADQYDKLVKPQSGDFVSAYV